MVLDRWSIYSSWDYNPFITGGGTTLHEGSHPGHHEIPRTGPPWKPTVEPRSRWAKTPYAHNLAIHRLGKGNSQWNPTQPSNAILQKLHNSNGSHNFRCFCWEWMNYDTMINHKPDSFGRFEMLPCKHHLRCEVATWGRYDFPRLGINGPIKGVVGSRAIHL